LPGMIAVIIAAGIPRLLKHGPINLALDHAPFGLSLNVQRADLS